MTDYTRGSQYTGTTREAEINGRTVYIKTGFSTKDKWKSVEKMCQLAGVSFCIGEGGMKYGTEAVQKMLCSACGQQLPEEAKFCFKCGYKVEMASSASKSEESSPSNLNFDFSGLEVGFQSEEDKKPKSFDLSDFSGKYDAHTNYSRSLVRTQISSFDRGMQHGTVANYIQYERYLYFAGFEEILPKKEDGTEKKGKRFQTLVFGRVNLENYKIEVLKRCCSIWSAMDVSEHLLFSISHGRLWYISSMNDTPNTPEEERGNLAVKCLSLDSREENIVLELPKKIHSARCPIVNRHILTYIDGTNQKLVVTNLLTGGKSSKAASDIIGYNGEYIFFSKCDIPEAKNDPANLFAVSTNSGDISGFKKLFRENFGNTKAENLYQVFYIDCKAEKCYVNDSKQGYLVADFHGNSSPAPQLSAIYDGKVFYDGRKSDVAFNGTLHYVVRTEGDSGVFRTENANGQVKTYSIANPCDACYLTTCNELIFCNFGDGRVTMLHNGKRVRLFKTC